MTTNDTPYRMEGPKRMTREITYTAEAECRNCRRLIASEGVKDETGELVLKPFKHLDGDPYCDVARTSDMMAEPIMEGGVFTGQDPYKVFIGSPPVLYGAKVRSSWDALQQSLKDAGLVDDEA